MLDTGPDLQQINAAKSINPGTNSISPAFIFFTNLNNELATILGFSSRKNFQRFTRFRSVLSGSVDMNFDIDQNQVSNDPGTSISQASFTDFGVLSVDSASTATSDSDSSINLGLVLGVTIPLLVLSKMFPMQSLPSSSS